MTRRFTWPVVILGVIIGLAVGVLAGTLIAKATAYTPAGIERIASTSETTDVATLIPPLEVERTTTSTTAPVAKVKHVTGTYTPAYALQTVALIRDGFSRFGPVVAEQAVRVAGCETGWLYDPRATNGDHDGLFQLSERYHRARAERLGFVWEQMLEPVPNIVVAADLYADSGWSPWTCQP